MKRSCLVIVFLGVAGILTSAVAAGTSVGQLAVAEARIDGILSPTGTTVMSPSKVQTGDAPSVIHLSTGGRLYLGPNSGALLEAGETGGIQVALVAGLAQLEDAGQGEVTALAPNSLAEANEEGDAIDPDLRVCVLASEGDNLENECAADHALKGCKWNESTAGELEEGVIYFVPADDDEDCDDGIAAWIWGAGAVGSALVLNDAFESDDDTAVDVSPSVP